MTRASYILLAAVVTVVISGVIIRHDVDPQPSADTCASLAERCAACGEGIGTAAVDRTARSAAPGDLGPIVDARADPGQSSAMPLKSLDEIDATKGCANTFSSEESPQSLGMDLELALLDLGIDAAEARRASDDFMQTVSHVEKSGFEAVTKPDAEASEPTPESVARDLERALLDAGIDESEARSASRDFMEQNSAVSPPAHEFVGDEEAADASDAMPAKSVAGGLERALVYGGADPQEAGIVARELALQIATESEGVDGEGTASRETADGIR